MPSALIVCSALGMPEGAEDGGFDDRIGIARTDEVLLERRELFDHGAMTRKPRGPCIREDGTSIGTPIVDGPRGCQPELPRPVRHLRQIHGEHAEAKPLLTHGHAGARGSFRRTRGEGPDGSYAGDAQTQFERTLPCARQLRVETLLRRRRHSGCQ